MKLYVETKDQDNGEDDELLLPSLELNQKLKNEKIDIKQSFGKGKIEVFVLNQYLNNEKFEQDKTEVIKKITKKIENGYKEDEIFDLDIGVMGNYRIEICNYLVNADYIASYELVGNSKISCKINRRKILITKSCSRYG